VPAKDGKFETIILDQPGAWVRIEIGTGPMPGEVLPDEVIDVEAELLELVPVEGGIKLEFPQPTPRELDVLRLVVEGYTSRQAAKELGISTKTVESHRANVMGKLGVSNRMELVRYAKCHNII